MSRFNTAAVTRKTTNKSGGSAFSATPELEFVSAILTTFLQDKFYQTGKGREAQIVKLLDSVDPHFAAQAALYARNEFGMRSVSHLVAAELAERAKGSGWGKRFYAKVVRRPDDILEILSYYKSKSKKAQTHAMRKGFAEVLATFDDYQLAKYRAAGKGMKLVDAVNLTHPTSNGSLTKLVNDELRNTKTWEATVSAAGSDETAKSAAWAEMVNSGQIGQMALLKNLRNILENAPEVTVKACELLTSENRIRKSLILPFRYATALGEIEKVTGVDSGAVRQVIAALSTALDKSAVNVPKFDGNTLIAIDTSGSMYGNFGWGASKDKAYADTPIAHASLFGALLAKSNNADIMLWDTSSGYVQFNPNDSTLTIANAIIAKGGGGGTNMNIVFQDAHKKYDRVVILTDMESWGHTYYNSPSTALAKYRTRCGADPMVYAWDLQGYGTLQFPERQVATLAGWSDKVFDIMKLVETDKQALISEIKKIEV